MEANPELILVRNLKNKLYKKLLEVAGPDQVYWKRFKDFMIGKLSRAELDYYASFYFVDELIDIHNEFILTVVKCASLPLEMPIRPKVKGMEEKEMEKVENKKRARGVGERNELLDRQQLKAIIKQMSKEEREKLKNLTKVEREDTVEEPYDITKINNPKNLSEEDFIEYQQGVMVPLCSESKSLPNQDEMYLRLKAKVLNCGLKNVEEKVAEYILNALENHLQTVMAAVIEKTHHKKLKGSTGDRRRPILYKPKSILDLPTVTNPDPKGSKLYLDPMDKFPGFSFFPRLPFPRHEDTSTISSRDLFTTFTMSPYLLVETPQAMQRLTIIHDHAYYPDQVPKSKQDKLIVKRRSTSRGSIHTNNLQLNLPNLFSTNTNSIGTSKQDLFGVNADPTPQIGLFATKTDIPANTVGLFGTKPIASTTDLFATNPANHHEFKSVLQTLSPTISSIDFANGTQF